MNFCGFDQPEALYEQVCRRWRAAEEANGGDAAIMLSGGSTPYAIYALQSRRGYRAPEHLHFFYSDERYAAALSPSSNAGRANEYLRQWGVSAERNHPVDTTLELQDAAQAYDRELKQFVSHGGKLKLGLLGIGTDGHTASLFEPRHLADSSGRYAIAVMRPEPPHRISVTPELLAQFDELLVLAVGTGKKAIIDQLWKTPTSIVAGMVLQNHPDVQIFYCEG